MKKTGDNPYLHTEQAHKDWYNRPIMGNLGDHNGIRREESTKEPLKRIRKRATQVIARSHRRSNLK